MPTITIEGSIPRPPIAAPELSEGRRRLNVKLEDFKDPLLTLEPSWSDLQLALEKLNDIANDLAYSITGSRTSLQDLRDICRRAIPPRTIDSGEAPIFEVRHPADLCYPFEFLRFLGVGAPVARVSDPRALEDEMSRYVGMSSIVTRLNTENGTAQDSILNNRHGLPIKFFRNSDLEGANQELIFFTNCGTEFDLEKPWPSGPHASVVDLATFLLQPSLSIAGTRRTVPDQIHHFACHCYTDTDDPDDYWIELKDPAGASVDATLGQLKRMFSSDGQQRSGDELESLPLVFMNACGSSVISPDRASSFPRLFEWNHNRGFIGTETSVPDDFAAAFSAAFYEALLTGMGVGSSLLYAKWDMLRKYRNPLGILYTMYAEPSIHVSHPSRGVIS